MNEEQKERYADVIEYHRSKHLVIDMDCDICWLIDCLNEVERQNVALRQANDTFGKKSKHAK